ncbi:MAG: phospholipase [Alphaproteobacteria bacterium]|nr:phospholipase [Alphaproteobacteria bacterium]
MQIFDKIFKKPLSTPSVLDQPEDGDIAPKKTVVVLFNYGGGMRGLIPAHLMNRIEEATGLRMADMVDVFMGPSTGSILNAALTLPHPDHPDTPRYKARHMVWFYEREGARIFPQDAFRSFRGLIHDFNNRTMKISQLNWLLKHGYYDSANLGRALRALFGRARLSDSLSSLVIPTYNIDSSEQLQAKQEDGGGDYNLVDEGGRALWLKNMKLPGARLVKPTPDVSTFDAVMASTAAPTYFPCHQFFMSQGPNMPMQEVAGIDGSIFDNPCVSYMGALRHHIPAGTRVIMIVLGTGTTNRAIKKDQWNSFGSLGVVDPANDLPLINIFFHASESAMTEAFAAEMGDNCYLFNKSLISGPYVGTYPSANIDDSSEENIRRMKNFSEMILEENKNKFDIICNLLVQNRDRNLEAKQKYGKNQRVSVYSTSNAVVDTTN